jgi:hypothetical protein
MNGAVAPKERPVDVDREELVQKTLQMKGIQAAG